MRQFTRKDVEDDFQKFWGATYRASGDTITINGITWLSGVTPPLWRIDFSTVSRAGHRYHAEVLLIQRYRVTLQGRKEFYLTSPDEQTLPEGCASVKDENALLRQREAEQVATPLTDEENTSWACID